MSPARIWWRTIRPATLWAGAVPVIVGSALAFAAGARRWDLALLALLGALGLQIGCNLVNDHADHVRGADGADRLGPARASASGWLSARQVLTGAAIAFGATALAGAALIAVGGWPIALLGVLSLLAAIGYTAGPYPLGYLGLGDLCVLLFFGFGAVVGTCYALTGAHPPEAWLAGLAVGALATAILVVNNLRDRQGDARVGKRTLAVRFGARAARIEYATLVAIAYLAAAGLAAWTGRWGFLLPWLTAPLAARVVRAIWRTDGAALNPLLGATARLELAFGVLLAGGALA